MWSYRPELPIAVVTSTIEPQLATQITNLLNATPDKGTIAGIYLKQRRLAEEDICDMLTNIAAEELSHMDILLEIMRKLKSEGGAIPDSFNAFSAMTPPSANDDLITSLYLDLYIEQTVRATLEKLAPLTKGTGFESPVDFIIMQDIRHTRQIAEALRLSLFRYGMCDPFLPCEGQSDGSPSFNLNGRAEGIEYYLDPKTGRYACRSVGTIAVHD